MSIHPKKHHMQSKQSKEAKTNKIKQIKESEIKKEETKH